LPFIPTNHNFVKKTYGNFGNINSFLSFAAAMEIKDRIKQKADELYRRYGVKSVTMDEIASQLGVSKKTIYQSFSDKNELVDAVIIDMLDFNKICCHKSQIQSENAVHEIFLAIENFQHIMINMNPAILFDIKRGYPQTFQKFSDYKYDFLFKIIKNNIERGKREGLYREELDADMIAKVRIENLMLPFNEEVFPRSEYSLVVLQQEMMEYFLFGMVTLKGNKLISKYQKERSEKNGIKKTEQ
jgi:AcrR family transcriptional regulator